MHNNVISFSRIADSSQVRLENKLAKHLFFSRFLLEDFSVYSASSAVSGTRITF